MPTSQANYIDILAAVTDDDSNFCAVKATVTGGYTVDWGDGTVENVASGTQSDHKYTYSTLGTPVTSLGYKTAIIRIYPQAANNITAFDIGVKNATAGLAAYSNQWLDIQVNTPSCTSMTYRGGVEARWVERINIIAIGGITTLASAFQSCTALRTVSFPVGSLTGVTTLASAFQSCVSLQTVSFPVGSLTGVTNLTNAFLSCSVLQTVSFPVGSLTGVTNLTSAFQSCTALRTVSFPVGSLTGVTTLASAFQSCFSLQTVSFPVGSLTGVTNLASAFQSCSALQTVSFPVGSFGAVTTTTSAFVGVSNLERIINCAIPVTFALPCNLSATELNEIYTALPVVVGQTLTVSGNYGFAASTQAIATGKGWTLA